jgi:hypothetical protein
MPRRWRPASAWRRCWPGSRTPSCTRRRSWPWRGPCRSPATSTGLCGMRQSRWRSFAARTSPSSRPSPRSPSARWRWCSAATTTRWATCARCATWPRGPAVPGSALAPRRRGSPSAGGAPGRCGRGPAPARRALGVAASAADGGRPGGPNPPAAGRGPVRSGVLRRLPAHPAGGGRHRPKPAQHRHPDALSRHAQQRGNRGLEPGVEANRSRLCAVPPCRQASPAPAPAPAPAPVSRSERQLSRQAITPGVIAPETPLDPQPRLWHRTFRLASRWPIPIGPSGASSETR